jgi:hypothetical protein
VDRFSTVLLLLPVWAASCAGGSDGLQAVGRVGEVCHPCRCGLGEEPCDCEECLDRAYDPVEGAILN